MRGINNKGSIFIYILLLISVTSIMGILVCNNSFIISNNINIGKYSEEVFSNIYDKGHIAINSVKDYNSNGNGFEDLISCPTNITMSGSTNSGTLSTNMVYSTGSIYCSGDYFGKELRIYYDKNFSDFKKAYYEGDIVDINQSNNTIIGIGSTNIARSALVTGTTPSYGSISNITDGDNSTFGYESIDPFLGYPNLIFNLGEEKNIGLIKIYKPSGLFTWNFGEIDLYDGSYTYLSTITIPNMDFDSLVEIDLKYFGLTNGVKYIEIFGPLIGDIELNEVEIYEIESSGTELIWEGDENFNTDSTKISFTSDGIGTPDLIDDDFNSDNYKVTSTGNAHYPFGYEDDDVIPRKIFFGHISSGVTYHNIFWNNYKTNGFIDNNPNNNDDINIKIGDVEDAYMYLDLYNSRENFYDLKILEFDKNAYQNEFTILPVKSTNGTDLTQYLGYIQTSSGELSLSKNKTGNEYEFDFKNKDYGIFLSNTSEGSLAYKFSAETTTGTGIYINPINDSGSGTIDIMANYIIMGGERNFIGENFIVSGLK